MENKPHIEIILPVYNEVQNIVPLVRELDAAIEQLKDRATVGYLFINDGSTDGTTELLYRLHRQRTDMRIVNFIHNFGHSAAIAAGIDHFKGDAAVLMDSDLQDSPDALIDLYREWQTGSTTVVAERADRKEKNKLLFKMFYKVFHKLNSQFPPINFGTHCLLDKTVVQRLKALKERDRYFPGLVRLTSGKISPIPIDRNDRLHGKSRVGTFGLIKLAITAFLSFSTIPVRLVSLLGLFSAVFGFGLASIVISLRLSTDLAIPGWASTLTLISLFSGVQLLCLGIIGEYLARIHEEVKQRPLYLVSDTLDKSSSQKSTEAA